MMSMEELIFTQWLTQIEPNTAPGSGPNPHSCAITRSFLQEASGKDERPK